MKIGDNCWIFLNIAGVKSDKKLALGWIIGRDLKQPHKFKVRVHSRIYTRTQSQMARIMPKDKELIEKVLKNY